MSLRGSTDSLAVTEGPKLLRSHVRKRSTDERERRPETGLGVCGEVEVEQDWLAVIGEEDVGRLQIAMENSPLVGMGQAVGHSSHQPEDRLHVAHSAEALDLGRGGLTRHRRPI